MDRIFQDTEGEINELVNCSVEQLICIDGVDQNTTFANIFLIWLKVEQQQCWYRIFLDAGGCFCSICHSSEFEEYYTEDIDNCEDCPVYHLESRFSIQELMIVSALIYPSNDFCPVKLKIVFHNGDHLILQEEKEPDSDNNLSIIKSAK